MTSIDNEQAKAEARAAREQAKAEAKAEAQAEAQAAREQAKSVWHYRLVRKQARAAREQAKAEAKAKAKAEAQAKAQAAREQAIAAWRSRLARCEQLRMRRTQRAFEARKLKVINTEDLEKEMEDVCILCLDKHQIKDSIVTSCNHMFGFECFQAFINTNENYNKHCPMCRNTEYSLTSFKARKPPTRKNNDTHSLTQ